MRGLGVVVGLVVLAGGAAGCGGSGGDDGTTATTSNTAAAETATTGESTATKPLRYGIPASNVTTGVSNPATIQATDGPVLSIAYESITHINPDGTIGPGLATEWKYVDEDQKIFEFTLRDDAKFSDGTPVTAEAVVGWLEYYLKSENVYSGLLGKNPKFEAVDPLTVRITMTAPLPSLPFMLSEANVNWGFVASPKAVADPDLMKNATYGAGPYMLDPDQSVPGDHYTYVPNPHYYDKSKIRFTQVEMKAFKDPSTALQAQQAGQIDVGWTTDASTAQAAEGAGLTVVSAPFAVFYAALNSKGQKPLQDVRVRQALNYALDRKAISNALYGKYGVPSSQFTIPPDANPEMEDHYAYDPDKAKALLSEAGYPDGFSFQIDVRADPTVTKAAELLAHYLDAVGVKTKVQVFQTNTAFYKRALPLKDDAAIYAGDVGVPTPIEYPSYIAPGAQLGAADPDNPKVDELYQKGLRSSDPAEFWKPMWAITVTDAWFLPYTASSDLAYVSDGVEGVEMSAARPYAYPPEWSFK
jgi:peptide/nickel transport system substrate-binding protein